MIFRPLRSSFDVRDHIGERFREDIEIFRSAAGNSYEVVQSGHHRLADENVTLKKTL